MPTLRFKTDENMHPDAAALLREHGHNVLTVWDESLRGTTDSELARVCREQRRTLITFDADFADIRTYPPSQHSGVVVLRTTDQSRRGALLAVARLANLFRHQSVERELWIVDDVRVRRRTGL